MPTKRAETIGRAISSDTISTPAERRLLADRIPGAVYAEIDSDCGRDVFLVDQARLNAILNPFIEKIRQ